MIVIPTLEIRNGQSTFGPGDDPHFRASLSDPTTVARTWAAEGFTALHVVDVDAVGGIGSNASIVDDVIRDGEIDVHAKGGAQTNEGVQALIDAGAARVVLGTRAIAEPDWLAQLAETSPGLFVVEVLLRDRRVVVRGWVRSLPRDIFDVTEELAGLPLAALLISGHAAGEPRTAGELGLLEDLVEACEFPIMVSGGIIAPNDLRALQHRGVSAAIVGDVLASDALDPRAVSQEFVD